MELFAKFLELLKVPTHYAIGVFAVVFALIFAPSDVFTSLGVLAYRQKYDLYAWVVLLGCGVILVSRAIGVGIERHRNYMICRSRKKLIQRMSVAEKEILCQYVENHQNTVSFSPFNTIVGELVAAGILYQVSSLTYGYCPMAGYSIREWAWDYLNNHPSLVAR